MTMMQKIKKYSLVFLGSISLAIGIVGIFLPLLPTTPLLLLSAFCYLRSSEKLYNWLLHHRILGAYIYNYMTYKAIPKKTKLGALVFLWATLSISAVMVPILHVRIFLLLVGLAVSIHLLTLKTMNPKEMEFDETEPDSPKN